MSGIRRNIWDEDLISHMRSIKVEMVLKAKDGVSSSRCADGKQEKCKAWAPGSPRCLEEPAKEADEEPPAKWKGKQENAVPWKLREASREGRGWEKPTKHCQKVRLEKGL